MDQRGQVATEGSETVLAPKHIYFPLGKLLPAFNQLIDLPVGVLASSHAAVWRGWDFGSQNDSGGIHTSTQLSHFVGSGRLLVATWASKVVQMGICDDFLMIIGPFLKDFVILFSLV